jgi:hypothetical protein
MGTTGLLKFNLTSSVSTAGLFLYTGEVGNNGEVASSSVVVRETSVPEPANLVLLALGFAWIFCSGRRRAA